MQISLIGWLREALLATWSSAGLRFAWKHNHMFSCFPENLKLVFHEMSLGLGYGGEPQWLGNNTGLWLSWLSCCWGKTRVITYKTSALRNIICFQNSPPWSHIRYNIGVTALWFLSRGVRGWFHGDQQASWHRRKGHRWNCGRANAVSFDPDVGELRYKPCLTGTK